MQLIIVFVISQFSYSHSVVLSPERSMVTEDSAGGEELEGLETDDCFLFCLGKNCLSLCKSSLLSKMPRMSLWVATNRRRKKSWQDNYTSSIQIQNTSTHWKCHVQFLTQVIIIIWQCARTGKYLVGKDDFSLPPEPRSPQQMFNNGWRG